jgi:hypothetical protein
MKVDHAATIAGVGAAIDADVGKRYAGQPPTGGVLAGPHRILRSNSRVRSRVDTKTAKISQLAKMREREMCISSGRQIL